MDEGSASGEPDVGTIDLSSHLSGRRRSGAASTSTQYVPSICAHTHTHMYTVFSPEVFKTEAWALVENFHCLLRTMTTPASSRCFY